MLVGHVAAGFFARQIRREESLGLLVFAAVLADLLAFAFIIAGVERVEFLDARGAGYYFHPLEISFSHSLLSNVLWGAIVGGALLAARKPRATAVVAAALVVSHWVLDVVSHPADVPLAPGLPWKWGLGLWTSVPATLIIEGGLWGVALLMYVRGRRRWSMPRKVLFWLGVVLLTVAWYGNIAGPPPSDPRTAPVSSLIFFSLIVAWSFAIDRRSRKGSPS
jgi:hypothetical protein